MTNAPHKPGFSSDASADSRIVTATLMLIAESGLGSLTMMRIAETAGVARQTLYNHYPDVDSIVAEAIRRHNRESIDLLKSALDVLDRPEDRLEQLVRHSVAVGAHAHHARGIEQGLSAAARATLREYEEVLDQYIRRVLVDGQESGVFRDDLSPNVDAGLIRHMLDGLAAQSAAAPQQAASIATSGARTVLAAVAQG
ncbi:MAG: TetR/AcrR family transcriptional regulator [Acidimicrobiia bacterium]|nr:TetR/AcrR family transcriptional regulator [Acidimicrobiia bacterium]